MQSHEDTPSADIDTAGQYLTFLLDDVEYGVEILKVQEIKSWGPYTPLPNSPEFVLGVLNLRGAIVPIIDLRKKFELSAMSYNSTTAVIIIHSTLGETSRIVGLVVDRVSEVYHIESANIQEAIPQQTGSSDSHVKGYGQIDEKLVIILNLDPIVESALSDEETP